MKPLRYAASDAKKIADALVELGLPEENVVTLISGAGEERRPSREKIMAALDEIVAKSGKNSRIFVTFSGHGFETLEDGAAAFAPTDVKVEFRDDAPCVLKDSAVLMIDVIKKLQDDDAKYKFLIVDACRELATVAAYDQRRGEGEKNHDAQNFLKKNGSKAFANLREIAGGLAFLQSCSSGQTSWEYSKLEGGGGGIFTFHLVEGLLGKAAKEDGKGDGVTFKDLCGYVRKKTRDAAEAIGTPAPYQNPVSNYVNEADSENEPDDFDVVSPIKPRIARLLLEEAKKLRKLGRDEVRGYDLEK
ncbi:MAG: caspase family protein, partial [Thermoguttaceae bacterium]|nr:caspase family protein [Thermoguttaceae bacterium]